MSTLEYLSSSSTFDKTLLSTSTIEYSTVDVPQSTFVEFKLSGPYIMVLVVYMSICAVGLAGNLSVIYIILRFPKMKSVTNLYILNLAIADVMFLTGIPFLVTTMVLMRWPFGYVVCKAYWITANVNQFVSSVFYLVLSGDRFVAVYLALTAGRKYRRPDIAKTVCACIWIFATLIMIPIMRHARTVVVSRNVLKGENIYSCQVVWPEPRLQINGTNINGTSIYAKRKFSFDANKAFTSYTFAFGYGIPVLLTAVFYFFVLARLKKSGPKDTGLKTKTTKSSHNSVISFLLCHSKPIKLSPNISSQRINDDLTESKLSLVSRPPAKITSIKEKCKNIKGINDSVRSTLDSNVTYSALEFSKITTSPECQQKYEPSNVLSTNVVVKDSAQKKRKKKSLRKVTTMVMTIITVYVSCWTPYWVLQLILGFRNKPMPPHTIYISMFVYCLAYANSCMNPILYAFLSDNFKVGFQKLFSSPCFNALRRRCRTLNILSKSEAPTNNVSDKASDKKTKVHTEKSFYNPEAETSFCITTRDTGVNRINETTPAVTIRTKTFDDKVLQFPRITAHHLKQNLLSGNKKGGRESKNISDFAI